MRGELHAANAAPSSEHANRVTNNADHANGAGWLVDTTCGADPIATTDSVTGNDADALLPARLVAVHVTVVVPSANADPDAGLHTGTIAPSTASSALTWCSSTSVTSFRRT